MKVSSGGAGTSSNGASVAAGDTNVKTDRHTGSLTTITKGDMAEIAQL